MLRESCESAGIELDIRVVADSDTECGIAHYRPLLAFADALLARDLSRLDSARNQLRAVMDDDGVARAAAVTGNFQMMNRALDTLGAQLGKSLSPGIIEMAESLSMRVPSHWKTETGAGKPVSEHF